MVKQRNSMIENEIMLEENLVTVSEIGELAVAAQQTRRIAAWSAIDWPQ